MSETFGVPQWMPENRYRELLALFQKYKGVTDEITFFTSCTHPPLPLDEVERRCAYWPGGSHRRALGYRAGINVLSTIGHHEENLPNSLAADYTRVTDIMGNVCRGSFCPNDPRFQQYVRQLYRLVTDADPDYIWIDDDIRLAGHMPIGLTCFCNRCLAIFAKESGRTYTRASLREAILDGPPEQQMAIRNSARACISGSCPYFGSAPPNMSASKTRQYVKGKSSRKLMMKFRHLNKQFWGRHMWARGYFVASRRTRWLARSPKLTTLRSRGWIRPRSYMVSIMPCTAKKSEIIRSKEMYSSGYQDVDVSITTREFARMIKQSGIDFVTIPDEPSDRILGCTRARRTIFGATGGVMEAALRTAYFYVTGKDAPRSIQATRGLNGVKEGSIEVAG